MLRDAHELGGDTLAVQVRGALERRILGRGEHPPHLAETLLGVHEIANARERRLFRVADLVLGDPVLAGEAGVEDAVGDVARHFLGADQHAFDLGIVDRREIRSRIDAQDVARALEQLDGRVLQRSFWNA